MNIYQLSRNWFDFSFENPNKIKPIHTAIYFFAIEHCNRLGWKKTFGFPTSMVLEAIGIRSYSSYKKHFDELASFGFIKVVEYSKNQYSSNIIELTLNDKALSKALDKAFIKHSTKQSESTVSINKPINKEPIKQYKKLLLSELKNSDVEIKQNLLNSNFTKYLDTALAFQTLFINNLKEAGASIKNLEVARGTWIDDIRLMYEVDKYKEQQFREVFEFLKIDDFWKANIQSTSKLRKQMSKLLLKIKSQNNGTKQSNKSGITDEGITNAINAVFGEENE